MERKQLRIALPNKGRLAAPSVELLKKCNVKIENGTEQRKLYAGTSDPEIEVIFVRAEDIPEYVERGAADAGITGEDLVAEKCAKVRILAKLGFGKCRIAIAGKQKIGIKDISGKTIATKMPNATSEFMKKNGLKATILPVKGATEIAPGMGIADLICDHVSTGATLAANSLVEIATVMESEACLICTDGLAGRKREILDALALMVWGTNEAAGKKYVMMNVSEKDIPRIVQLVPGMRSPTIMQLAAKGECALHTVADAKTLPEKIRRLKELGARDILVLGIEQIVR
ncbi:ATP phosphoribosyltransferase [Candidatus Parvarchaeota archaeon]|nr:ATP phosphoribosyltransferase [Candidatus Parvarchaeota archaeon]